MEVSRPRNSSGACLATGSMSLLIKSITYGSVDKCNEKHNYLMVHVKINIHMHVP